MFLRDGHGIAMKLPQKYSQIPMGERRWVREAYINKQEGLCYYCRKPLNNGPPKDITDKPIDWSLFPENFLDYPVHLQHNHETDMTEGAVHAYCNAVMWQYEGR